MAIEPSCYRARDKGGHDDDIEKNTAQKSWLIRPIYQKRSGLNGAEKVLAEVTPQQFWEYHLLELRETFTMTS